MSSSKAYTVVYDEIMRAIIIPVIFKSNTTATKVNVLIDTGATGSFVSEWIARGSNATKLPMISHTAFAEGVGVGEVYEMDIMFSSDIIFKQNRLTTISDQYRKYDAVIGMDILSKVDFSISNYNGRTIFTLRTPSQGAIKYGDVITTNDDIDNLFDSFEVPL